MIWLFKGGTKTSKRGVPNSIRVSPPNNNGADAYRVAALEARCCLESVLEKRLSAAQRRFTRACETLMRVRVVTKTLQRCSSISLLMDAGIARKHQRYTIHGFPTEGLCGLIHGATFGWLLDRHD